MKTPLQLCFGLWHLSSARFSQTLALTSVACAWWRRRKLCDTTAAPRAAAPGSPEHRGTPGTMPTAVPVRGQLSGSRHTSASAGALQKPAIRRSTRLRHHSGRGSGCTGRPGHTQPHPEHTSPGAELLLTCTGKGWGCSTQPGSSLPWSVAARRRRCTRQCTDGWTGVRQGQEAPGPSREQSTL